LGSGEEAASAVELVGPELGPVSLLESSPGARLVSVATITAIEVVPEPGPTSLLESSPGARDFEPVDSPLGVDLSQHPMVK